MKINFCVHKIQINQHSCTCLTEVCGTKLLETPQVERGNSLIAHNYLSFYPTINIIFT